MPCKKFVLYVIHNPYTRSVIKAVSDIGLGLWTWTRYWVRMTAKNTDIGTETRTGWHRKYITTNCIRLGYCKLARKLEHQFHKLWNWCSSIGFMLQACNYSIFSIICLSGIPQYPVFSGIFLGLGPSPNLSHSPKFPGFLGRIPVPVPNSQEFPGSPKKSQFIPETYLMNLNLLWNLCLQYYYRIV